MASAPDPGGNRDPYAIIDEKLAPAEATGLKSLIHNTLHAFSYDDATGTWSARNEANRITFTYTPDGTATFSQDQNTFGLTLLGIGRDGTISPAKMGVTNASGRQLNVTRQEFTEWYRNNDEGIEQGITIMNRPAGSSRLKIGFWLTGNNTVSVENATTLTLVDATGAPLFTYTGLHAFDSEGRTLPATLTTDGTMLTWVVDDTGAVYPVTIDPVVVSASKATAQFTGGAQSDYFGNSVSLSADGTRALIGACYNDTAGTDAGAAYIFEKPAGGWSGTTTASAATARFTGGNNSDWFGWSVALSSDGTRALVGAYYNDTAGSNAGAAYLFKEPAGGWSGTTSASSATARFTGGAASDCFGYSVSLSSDGKRALVGAYSNRTANVNIGAAYIFKEPAEGWSGTTSASAAIARFAVGASSDYFGNSVSLSSDGTRALVGANNNRTAVGTVGAAYIFDEPAGGWNGTTSASAATARFTGVSGQFGWSVLLSSDGTRVLVGAKGVNSNTGAAYIFQPPYVTLTAGGTTTGAAGTVVDGLTLNPTGNLTNVDLYLGTDAATPTGTAIKTGISSLPASVATTVDGVDLAGKTAGTYYLIVNESGTTTLLGASSSAVYTVTAPAPAPTITVISPDSGPLAAGTLVNITGTNLAGATSVTFGSNAATGITKTDTTINMTAPGGSVGAVTVTVTTPGGTATTSYTYTGDPIPGVIGFRWNTSDPSPRLYQIDSDGTVIPNAKGDWFNTHLPWGGMKTVVVNASNATPVLYGTNNRGDGLDLSGTYGDVMVEIPRFYTCSTYANGNFSYWISPDAQDALHYTVAPMFNQRGTGTDAGTPAPYYYVGRYDASLVGTKLQSATGKAPAVSMTIAQARTYAGNKGAGWGITNVWTMSGLRQLFYTEMVTLNSQAAWTNSWGIVDSAIKNSGADSIDTQIFANNATGSGTGADYQTPVSYRGIENLWGNVWQFQDGFNAITTKTDVINATGLGLNGQKTTFKDVLDANDKQSVGTLLLTGDWQKNLINTDVARPLFLPSAGGGSETTYLSDRYLAPSSTTPTTPDILMSGGDRNDVTGAGIGSLSASTDASTSYSFIGARLEFRPSLAPVASFSSKNISIATNTTSQGWAGTAPFTMVFNDTSTNMPTSWKWGRNNLTVTAWEPFSTTNNATQTFVAGNWSVNLTATNAAGSSISGVTWVNVSATPTITIISPSAGPLAAGTLVNITGTNLAGTTSVTFGSNAATGITKTATTINMTAPAGSAGPVTVTVTTPGGTATTSYTYIGDPIDGVIGFRWNTSDPSPRLYQIDSDGTVIPNATGDWFNTHLPWSGMKTVVVNASNATPVLYGTNNRGDGLDLSGAYGDVMVEIPIFYTCSTYANGNFSYWISPGAQDALHYTVAPMFNQRGTGTNAGTTAPYYYIGRYDANLVGTKLQSATGKAPAVLMTIGTARTYAENKGAGWGITNVWTLSGLRQLFYTEMVSLNSQAAWAKSRGIVDTTGAKISGADSIDTNTYTANATGSGTGTDGYTPVSYRGIENLWGNVWQFQDGFNALKTPGTTNVINATGLGLTGQKTTFKDLLDENDRQSVGALPTTTNAGSYQTNLLNPDIVRPLFLPSAVGGSATTYLSDKIWSPTSSNTATPNILFSGGAWYDAGDAGVGSLVVDNYASFSHAALGARLEFRRSLAPVASFSSRNTSVATNTTYQGWAGVAPFTMVFNDTSTNYPAGWSWGRNNLTATAWERFSTTNNATQTFVAGNWSVNVTAINSGGAGISGITWVNVSEPTPAPVANFIGTPTAGTVPLTVTFTDSSTNTSTSWNWSFGDGSRVDVTEQNPVHTYSTAGTYTVSLNATNAGGSNVSVRTDYITVRNPVISPNFTANVTQGNVPLTVSFTDESTNTPTGWAWFFGDENYTQPWDAKIMEASWAGRYMHSSVAMPDGSVVIMGGATGLDDINDVWRSTNNGTTWTQQTGNAGWSARNGLASVALPDGSIVLMGGFDLSYLRDVWRSTNNGTTWTQLTGSAEWPGRSRHSSEVMPDGSIILMGGGNESGLLNDVWRSTNNGLTWTRQTGNAGWSPRYSHASVVLPDGSLVIMGGYDGGLKNDVWRSVDNGATWTQLTASAGWSERMYHSSVALPDGSILLMGGTDIGNTCNLNDVWRSVDNGTTWTQLTDSAAWDPRYGQTSVAVPDGGVVLVAGKGDSYYHDAWAFMPAGSSVQNPSHTYTVPGTYKVSLQAYNSQGFNSTRKVAYITVTQPAPVAGFVATPVTGTVPLTVKFTDTSTNTPTIWNWSFGDSNLTNATVQNPVHTYSAAGTYTISLNATNAGGSNISVRTGYITVRVPGPVPGLSANITSGPVPLSVSFTDQSTNTPTGWAWFFGDENYTQPWTQQTASAEWSRREGHTGVTMPDGSIVLMGGLEGGGFTNDTWRSTDKGVTWTQLTASAGWSERQWHSSVVTQDGNIILTGGEAADGTKDDVWQSSDNGATWTLANAHAGWSPREFHSTVLLPDGSIVLSGGYDGSNRNDTWRSADNGVTWTQVNASSGWTARQAHTSVAMPDGSIVLSGGEDNNGYTNDTWQSVDKGATWTQVTASSGWSARARHSSVVMPDGNIVLLGGEDRNNRKNDVWQSADNGTTWTQVNPSAGWSARQGQKCVSLPDGSIVLIAGYDGGLTNDVWRLQPVGSSIQNPSHMYALQGNYSVALQAYNTGGYNSTRKAGYITVGAPAPVAGFTGAPTIGTVPLTVVFTDNSTNSPTS
ncbi:MAG: hypothetical protein STSR0009_16310 [Methanoregula sp.]